jgi:hypothetical protein
VDPTDYQGIDSALGLGQGNPLQATQVYDSPVRLSQEVSVENVTPAIEIDAPLSGVEGEPLFLTADVLDPGWDDTHSYSWTVTKDGASFTSGNQSYLELSPDGAGVYAIQLAVTDDDGAAATDSASVTVGLATPQDVTVISGSGSALVSWADVNRDETGFVVEWCADGSTWTSASAAASGADGKASYRIVGLSAASEYQVRVRAVKDALASDATVASAFTTLAAGMPMPPTNVTVDADVHEASVTWDSNPEATGGFEIQVFDPKSLTWKTLEVADAESTSAAVSGLVSGSTNSIRVVAFDDGGSGESGGSAGGTGGGGGSEGGSPSEPVDAQTEYGNGLVASWLASAEGHTLYLDGVSGSNSEETATDRLHDNESISLSVDNLPNHYGVFFSALGVASSSPGATLTVKVDGQSYPVAIRGGQWSFGQEIETTSDSVTFEVTGAGFDTTQGAEWGAVGFGVSVRRYQIEVTGTTIRKGKEAAVLVQVTKEGGLSPAEGVELTASATGGSIKVTTPSITTDRNGVAWVTVSGESAGYSDLKVKENASGAVGVGQIMVTEVLYGGRKTAEPDLITSITNEKLIFAARDPDAYGEVWVESGDETIVQFVWPKTAPPILSGFVNVSEPPGAIDQLNLVPISPGYSWIAFDYILTVRGRTYQGHQGILAKVEPLKPAPNVM